MLTPSVPAQGLVSIRMLRLAAKLPLDWARRLFAVSLLLSFVSQGNATPADELTRAVMAGATATVAKASPYEFLRAFTAVVVGVKPGGVPAYVKAAIRLRPDLADKIVLAALKTRRIARSVDDDQLSYSEIDRIIRAAVAADPAAAAAIVTAAIQAEPYARDCIVAAAIAAAPDQRMAFLQAAGEEEFAAENISNTLGTTNPENLVGGSTVNSPEQP